MTNPMISVVMPVYNGEKYLREAIDSILNQTYTDFEFIILNDGSTDRTEEIILSYDDPRIVYVKNDKNLQIVKTLNKGIALAKGKYIARMDADDISLPERFEKQIGFMEQNLDISVCGSYLRTIGGSQQHLWTYPISPESIRVALVFYSPLAHPSVMIRKKFFHLKKYTIEYQNAEDYFLWASCMFTHKFANLPEVLLLYRLHNNQTGTHYSNNQLELSNKIRLDLLNQLGLTPTRKEFEVHEKVSRYQYVDIYDAEKWLYKIYQHNKKNHLLDDKALKKFLDDKWWMVVKNATYKGMETFYYYHTSQKIKFYPRSLLKNIIFFLKSLLMIKSP